MSAPVLHFTPRAELGPQANLETFIALCRTSEVLDAREQLDFNDWDVGHLMGKNTRHRAIFSTLEASKRADAEPCFRAPLLEFAMAALVYLQDSKPVVSQAPRVAALRCLEDALRERAWGSSPAAVTGEVLEADVELARGQMSPKVVYQLRVSWSCCPS